MSDLATLRSEISSEDDLQQYIAAGMEQNGWTALREVKTAFDNYRADIIGHKDGIGAIGIECKRVTGGPVVVAEAARQIIDKYAGRKFVNWRVDMWAVCLYGRAFRPADERPTESHCRHEVDKSVIYTSERILNGLGIGFTTAHSDRVSVQFLPSGRSVHIPLFQVDGDMPDTLTDEFDRQRVLELITERRPE